MDIVRIRRSKGEIVQDCDIYIGRRISMGGWNLSESKWHNPFKIGRDGNIDEILDKYERYLFDSGLINDIYQLEGKILGCWCKPDRCHGDILVKLVRQYRQRSIR